MSDQTTAVTVPRVQGAFGAASTALLKTAAAAFAIALIVGTRDANAAGVAIFFSGAGTKPVPTATQNAFVAWRNGSERLLIDIGLGRIASAEDGATGELVWILPVAAAPSDVRARGSTVFPKCFGEPLTARASRSVLHAIGYTALSQLWTIPAVMPALLGHAGAHPLRAFVDHRIENRAATIEILPADALLALENRVKQWGREIPETTLRSLASELGPHRAFVLYRIVDFRAAPFAPDTNGLALDLEFPSPDGRVTFTAVAAVAAEAGGSGDIRVVADGFVAPVGDVRPDVHIQYVTGKCDVPPEVSSPSEALHETERHYTFINGSANPSSTSARDMLFARGVTRSTSLAVFFLESTLGTIFMAVIALAVFWSVTVSATLLASIAWPGPTRPSRWLFVRIGLLHVVTLLGPLLFSVSIAPRFNVSRRGAVTFVALSSAIAALLLLGLAAVTALALR